MKNNKLGARKWTVLVLFGLIGQIAWTIENMYLNVFMYKTITENPSATAWMVALSALVATIATITMGAFSDKIGKRKIFMSVGYIIWGVSIVAFAFITKDNVSAIFPNAKATVIVTVTVALMILLDCVMTFIGSSANDASFYAWVNDATNEHNRGGAEGLLATMPLLGMLVVFGALDGITQTGNWLAFFGIVGGIVTIAGVVGLFIVKDEAIPKEGNYWEDIIYGFRPKNIKDNWLLYVIFSAICLLGVAQQVFIPYFIIYFEYYIGITDYALLLGGILILASAMSFAAGFVVNKFGKKLLLIPATAVYIIGMVALFFLGLYLKGNMTLIIIFTLLAGTFMMGSYLAALVPLNALARDIIPEGRAGAFSGVRMVFFVLIPMVVGPFVGSTIIKAVDAGQIIGELGVEYIPVPHIFLAGAIIGLLTFIPLYFILKTDLDKYQGVRNEANASN